MSLAFFGPTPGSVSAGANSGSSKAGRMPLYTGARQARERRGRVSDVCIQNLLSPDGGLAR